MNNATETMTEIVLPLCACGAAPVAIKPGRKPVFARSWSAEMGAYDEKFGELFIVRGAPTQAWCMAHWPSRPVMMEGTAHGVA